MNISLLFTIGGRLNCKRLLKIRRKKKENKISYVDARDKLQPSERIRYESTTFYVGPSTAGV